MSLRHLTYGLAAGTLAAGVTLSVPVAGHAAAPAARPMARVRIQDFAFVPTRLTIRAGTTVVWTNMDAVAHTVTVAGRAIDSGALAPGKTFTHTFKKMGTYDYLCTIHPFMKGTVIVKR